MSLNPDLVKAAVASGLCSVCATCSKYWRARNQGIPEPRCLSADGCGSPLAGDTFHEYEGPLPSFERWCFRCAKTATHVIRVEGKPRLVGVCAEHLQTLAELEPVAERPLPGFRVRGDSGDFVPIQSLLPRPRKSLARTILETEKELDQIAADKRRWL